MFFTAEDIRMEEDNARKSAPSIPSSQANKRPPSTKQVADER